MIANDFLRGPQKKLLLSSSLGFIFTDCCITAACISMYAAWDIYEYIAFPNIFLSFIGPQIILYIVLLIIGLTCWKNHFFEKILETFCKRFFIFADLVISHAVYILLAIYFVVILSSDFHLYDPILLILLIMSISQFILLILLFVGLAMTFINKSDKEIIETNESNEVPHDFSSNPQKIILLISLILIFLFTFSHFVICLVFLSTCLPFDSSYVNICDDSLVYLPLNFVLSGFLSLFYIVLFVISRTCLKGVFIEKLIEKPSRMFSIILFLFLFNIIYVVLEFAFFFNSLMVWRNGTPKAHQFEVYSNLIFTICEIVSIIIFFVGLCLTNRQKNTLSTQPLIYNEDIAVE